MLLVSSYCSSRPRDATQNERDGAGAAQLRRSSNSVAAAAPSQQHYNLALKWSSHCRVPPRGAAGSTSRRDATGGGGPAAPRGGTRAVLPRSISFVAAVSAPSQQHQQAMAVSRDDEGSTGAFLLKLFQHNAECTTTRNRNVITLPSKAFLGLERAGCHSPCEFSLF